MNTSNGSSFPRLQFFINCSSMAPFHGLQSFRNRLLHRGSSTGLQVLPVRLLHRGLLSPWVHRSCQGACSCVGFPWGHSLLWAPSCCDMGSSRECRWAHGVSAHGVPAPWAAGTQLPLHALHHRLQGTLPCSTCSPSFCIDLACSHSSLQLQLPLSSFCPPLQSLIPVVLVWLLAPLETGKAAGPS